MKENYHLHFRNSDIYLLYLDLNYLPETYGGLDYRLIFDGETISGYLTKKGKQQAYKLGKNLFDEKYSQKIIQDFTEFNNSVTEKSIFHLVDENMSKIDQFKEITRKIKWLSKYYLYCEQPVLASLENFLEKEVKDKSKLNQILKNPEKFDLNEKTRHVVNVLKRLGEEKLKAHSNLGEVKALIHFSKFICQKYKIKIHHIAVMRENEFETALKGGEVDVEVLNKRLAGFVYLPPVKEGIWQCLVGDDYNDWYKKLLDISGGQVKGVVAYPGRVTGKVFIHKSFVNKSEIPKGSVLVTGMTNPQMMPYLKNAVAMVTDEGGLTCHAAIISREMKIPTIVGTKNATQFFKNGDMVEVDANKGAVKKI